MTHNTQRRVGHLPHETIVRAVGWMLGRTIAPGRVLWVKR